MKLHVDISNKLLYHEIRNRKIRFGGNINLKIYGTLQCKSGKRMKKENRIFFQSESEALQNGYRPCGHCMRHAYQNWKQSLPDHF